MWGYIVDVSVNRNVFLYFSRKESELELKELPNSK